TELLSNFDARDGSVAEDPFGVNVRLELEKEAGEKLAAYARSHPGQRLAVVSRGRVIVAPVMGGAIGSRIVIKVGNDAGARGTAQRVLNKWPEGGRARAGDPKQVAGGGPGARSEAACAGSRDRVAGSLARRAADVDADPAAGAD